ncbi:regulator of microtubule dynamics protein 1-like isoform X3 [Tenebrio molitor]|uniref:regulator of microtubule dynamics protein 1-like isoform X3 n=1 Tax=Tenebrio molitor TaxID=7067 RepID=UPI003624A321
MPLPQNINAIIGAGVFGIVCAATLYVVEHYRQDRRRHAMAKDLARLNNELAVLRRELDSLLAQQKQKATKRGKRNKRESLISTSTATEDYASAFDADSSDLEFYDVSDEEIDTSTLEDLGKLDATLDEGTAGDLDACVRQLQNLCLEFPENPQLLWRLAKAHYRLFEKTELTDHIHKGIEACTSALKLKPELANVHKWLAILLGSRTKIQPMKEKILDGHLFKEHVDAAIRLNPLDPVLHHMLGRFAYDIAELKWYERKVAAALFADPPNATYEEALDHFYEAEKLQKADWKENMLYIAKCKIKLGEVPEGLSILERMVHASDDNGVDGQVELEVKELLKKYSR